MASEEMKARWATKITTYEAYCLVMNASRGEPLTGYSTSVITSTTPSADGCLVPTLDRSSGHTWYLHREAVREAVGVYPEPSSVLKWMRSTYGMAGQYFPHVSKDDPTMVAYTPDRQAGLKDVQVRTTMGKLLRKFLLVVPDTEISRLEAQHRAEMDTSFELALTPAAIEEVYNTMQGDSACMRHRKDHFGHQTYHPSAAYSGAGLGVAYVKNSNGVSARSVVYVNPDDSSDKRYVRIYGDPVLKRKLEAQGYRCAGLAGVQLAALIDPAYPDKFVMPYVDPAGGMYANNQDRSNDSAYVVRYAGEAGLRMITDDTQRQLKAAGIEATYVRMQYGHIHVPEVDPASFNYTCPLTGLATDRLVVATGWYLTGEGKIVQARATALTDARDQRDVFGAVVYNSVSFIDANGKQQGAWALRDNCVKFSVPGHPSTFNDSRTRDYFDLCQLDAKHYGEGQYAAKADAHYTLSETWLKKTDVIYVYDVQGVRTVHHSSEVKALRKQGYVSTAVVGRIKALSHPDSTWLVTTVGGKRVLTHVHKVDILFDGRCEYKLHTITFNLMGRNMRTTKDTTVATLRLSREDVARLYPMPAASNDDALSIWAHGRVKQGLSFTTRMYPTYAIDGGGLIERHYYSQPTLAQLEAGVDRVLSLEATPDALLEALSYNREGALVWARTARHLLDLYHKEMSDRAIERAIAQAEASAVEAPARLGGINDDSFALAA